MHLLPTRRHAPSLQCVGPYGTLSSENISYDMPHHVERPTQAQSYDDTYLQPTRSYGNPHAQSQQSLGTFDDYLHPMQAAPWQSTSTINTERPQTAGAWDPDQASRSTATLAARPRTRGNESGGVAQRMNQGAAFCDRVAAHLGEMFSRTEAGDDEAAGLADGFRGLAVEDEDEGIERSVLAQPTRQTARRVSDNNGTLSFRRTWLYQNSRLPPAMVPFKAYMPTWGLVTRAARASLEAYTRPRRGHRDGYVAADPKTGTKAHMVLEQQVDDRRLVIVAIRGSQRNLVDWHVNFALAPTQPVGFLDDEGNACHAGFLQVARAMIAPVAAQLRRLIQEDSSCCGSSLVFTGHSSGAAVASLLYMHMMSKTVGSELTDLVGVFRRLHCVTFGAPPLSLLPLQLSNEALRRRNLYLSFANEGDLVVRADWPYMRSLARLISTPAPCTRPTLRERISRQQLRGSSSTVVPSKAPRWPVPEASLSNAGRMVLLREKPGTSTHTVEAIQLTDGELRGVVFGDLAMHDMTLYKRRIDDLAFAAVSGEGPS